MSIVDCLFQASENFPDKKAFSFYENNELIETRTFKELVQRASSIANELQKIGKKGEPICLVYAPGLKLIEMIFGVLIARRIPIIAAPPVNELLFRHLAAVAKKKRGKKHDRGQKFYRANEEASHAWSTPSNATHWIHSRLLISIFA